MVTLNAGLESPDAEFVTDWIARLKRDFDRVDEALGNAGMLQLLANPRFQVWQRLERLGVASWSANLAYAADRWQLSFQGAPTLVVTRVGTFAGGAPWELHGEYAHAAAALGFVRQHPEGWPQWRGRTVSFRLRAAVSAANAGRAFVTDGVASTLSAFHAGDGEPAWLDVTHTLDEDATTCLVGLRLDATCNFDLDGASLVHGSTPLLCLPLDPEAELRRCERYLEVHGGAFGFPYVRGYGAVGAGDLAAAAIPWRVRKGGAPTVTKAGTWATNNAGQPTIAAGNADGYTLQIASAAGGYFDAAPNGGDDLVYAEWNPS